MDFIASGSGYQYLVSRNDLVLEEHKDLVEKLPVSSEGFIVEFRYRQRLKREYSPHHDECRLLYYLAELVYVKRYAVSKVAVQRILCPRLSLMGIPQEDQDALVSKTYRQFSKNFQDSWRGLVPMVVEVELCYSASEEGLEGKLVDLARENCVKIQRFNCELSGQSFIKRLGTVRLMYDELESCGICLQRMEGDRFSSASLTWLPCSHAYHDRCVGKWLRIAHSCPMCRLQFTAYSLNY